MWAKALAKLNQDEKALTKINELSKNVLPGQSIHNVEELAMSKPPQEKIYMRLGDEEYQITTNQLYEELDKCYTDILTVVSIMYMEDEFDERFMISDHQSSKDVESGHEYTENED